MYYTHFGLKEAPFKITPNTEVFFTGANRGAVLQAMMYAIKGGEGIIKLVGEVGSGKTMLCRMLQTMLPQNIEQVYLANPSVAPEDILFAIAFELQLKLPKNAERLQVMQLLQKYLLDRHAEGKQVVIFVEEAQGMPLATLEEIRLLSNLETKHDKLLQIVLFGQPELDANLNATHIRQLRERITQSFRLEPISQANVEEYLMFRLRSAGYVGPPPFSQKAIKLLADISHGLVRRVNILADKALLAAFSENSYWVDVKHMLAAIADSEFGREQALRHKKRHLVSLILLGFLLVVLVWLLLQQGFIAKMANGWMHNDPEVAAQKVVNMPVKVVAETLPAQVLLPTPVDQSVAATNKNVVADAPQIQAASLAVESAPLPKVQELAAATLPVNDSLLQERLEATEEWFKSQSADTVSVQLMGSSNEALLTQHLSDLANKLQLENLYAYRTQVNGKPFVTILYGSYASRSDANAAIEQLPEAIKANQPRLRTIGGILKELHQ